MNLSLRNSVALAGVRKVQNREMQTMKVLASVESQTRRDFFTSTASGLGGLALSQLLADEEAVVREIDKQGAIIQGEYSDVDDIFFQRPEDE